MVFFPSAPSVSPRSGIDRQPLIIILIIFTLAEDYTGNNTSLTGIFISLPWKKYHPRSKQAFLVKTKVKIDKILRILFHYKSTVIYSRMNLICIQINKTMRNVPFYLFFGTHFAE
jgi:hypothetical protein